ncbi:DUF3085 domain-containing protein [Burkholderia multivorans]|uniref:DUF3085 domain-containing protein n=1 Tax=Burkholderia multivorans TaxID=87883 RepID=UPI001C23F8E9|nr:DUF3085 domain-containing protein [Burkholderia multivorans]MBU9477991.1 DUF3085 domain-containing protein [Burkholderia multivorans]
MIRFTASDLRPVLVEARTHACHLVLVNDQGVYMMTDKTNASDDGLPRLIAYATGCNPETVPFDDWWERARTEFGGDDFVEYLDPDAAVFDRVIDDEWDLKIRTDASHLYLNAVKPDA